MRPGETPASASGKLSLVTARVMHGVPLFQALRSISGARAALERRSGVPHTSLTHWMHEDFPEDGALKIVAVLNVPLSRIPLRDSRLARVRGDIRAGMAPMHAVAKHRWQAELSRRLALSAFRWQQSGIPCRHVARVAAILQCDPKAIPILRGRTYGPVVSPEQWRKVAAHRWTAERRAQASECLRQRPRNSQGQWTKKHEAKDIPRRFVGVCDVVGRALRGGGALAGG